MEEKLILPKTAKLAKQKRFDYSCHLFYEKENNIPTYFGRNIDHVLVFPAPTQSLLQKWLRDVHNIEICIKPIGNESGKDKSYSCVLMKFSFEKGRGTFVIFQGQETRGWIYEEVLEIGLQEALKLII